jgi:tol-pal system protein YbgF
MSFAPTAHGRGSPQPTQENAMKRYLPLICFIVLSLSGCAIQKDIAALDYRLAALERQNQLLRDQVQSRNQNTEKDLRSQYASTSAELEAVQEELRLLNGRIEELAHNASRKTEEGDVISRRVEDLSLTSAKLEQRLGRVEQYLDLERIAKQSAVSPAPAPQTAVAPTAPAPDSEQQLYARAKQSFDNKELDKSRQEFQHLLDTYPKSENADNAQYWIAESYYLEKWYEKAILEYQTVIEKYPKGNKVPSAMLKQAMSFLQLGDKSNARLIFKELEKRYPQSNEAKIAAQKLKEF